MKIQINLQPVEEEDSVQVAVEGRHIMEVQLMQGQGAEV